MSPDLASGTPFESEGIRGFLHQPPAAEHGWGLTHGAGGNCTAPLLVAVAGAFSAAGLCVLRCDLPFRQRRPSGPPSPATAAADRAGLRSAVEALRGLVAGRIYLGGHSYGGRHAPTLPTRQPHPAARPFSPSYPLHPPRPPS